MNTGTFKLIVSAILISITIVFTNCKQNNNTSEKNTFIPKDTSWKQLTLREKIGQTMIINSEFFKQENFEGGTLDTFFAKYPVGGFFMADWYFGITKPKDSIAYYIKYSIEKYAAASKNPLIFMEDFERGVGERFPPYTQLPVEMCLGAANNPQLAYDYEKSIALQAKDLGINWLLHPVCDLNMHPLHPLLNERAVSDNAELALPLLKKQMEALQENNIVATIKHFPGDGATIRDQHIFTAENPLPMDKWKQTYGKVFQSLIDYGAASVMVGHLTFPAYQKEKHNGALLPASLSKEIITDLLKKKMDFNGVVISDALNMGGIGGYYQYGVETDIECFKAGIDLLLWPEMAYMDTLEARIKRGEISMQRLNDAVQRIWALKERFGILDKQRKLITPLTPESQAFIDKTSKAIADNSVTLLKNEGNLLPIDVKKDTSILIVNISTRDMTLDFKYTKEQLEKLGCKVDLFFGLSVFDWNWRMNELDKYNRIIICFENRYLDPVGTPLLKGLEAQSVWMVNTLPKNKIIAVSYSNPYYLNFYFNNLPVLINAYSSDKFVQDAVVRAITGKLPFKGKSPVKLEQDILK